ncbi:RING finger protein 215 isoform X1 [Carcharodon carcharias]|uniref:RING finger protein 215 isoform X1 n=1 Tax=Carcharodon carcharias TaxID=13397 RepID=UPI001B7D9555|nr:RING finger protein 215 isoform X1 [Carcharodon carcharias]
MAVATSCWKRLGFYSLLAGYFFRWCAVAAEKVALVDVFLMDSRRGWSAEFGFKSGSSYRLQGTVLALGSGSESPSQGNQGLHAFPKHNQDSLEGSLILVKDEQLDIQPNTGEKWIGVVPVDEDQVEGKGSNKQESFAAAVVSKMKRALVLGASALLILVLNQNAFTEMDISQVLSKPVVVMQSSENVTKLLGALLNGLRASAKITFKNIIQDNLGVTLTLWSTCGRSRGGLYGEWQGVICTGENSSQVQKYLQQLWNTILLVGLILSTGVIVQAQWQYRHYEPSTEDMEINLKQQILKQLSALKTRKYYPNKRRKTQSQELESCAVCLEEFHKNQCLRVLPCLHEFHRDCVDPWLLLQQTCPLCKRHALGDPYENS